MNKNASKPLVSIIVPVYNGETYLRSTLDTLVNQTYENIEIIAVNNSSTDGTPAILEEYRAQYPEKIKVYTIPFEKYAGGTKNFGYNIAQGEYLLSCDADDLMQYRAVEKMVETALSGDYDVVKAPCYEIIDDHMRKLYIVRGEATPEKLILDTGCALYNLLIKKDFYVSHRPIAKEFNNDDFVYQCVSFVCAQKMGYCPYPVYYYFRRPASMINNLKDTEKMLNIFHSVDYILANNNTQYSDYVLFFTMRFVLGNISTRWVYADQSIGLLKKYWPVCKNNQYLLAQEGFYKKAELYASLPDQPMPNLVYINGFGNAEVETRAAAVKENAFYNGCDVVILNADNCDVHENPVVEKAFYQGEYDFVNGYFALKKIYDTGGIYLHSRVQIDAPLNYVKYFPCFFAFLSQTEYSDSIWGGMAKNPVIGAILQTYEQPFYSESNYPLSKRIKNILTAKYGIPLNGKTAIFKYAAVVFAPEVMVYNITDGIAFGSRLHMCSHNFSDRANQPDYYTLSKQTLQSACFTGGTALTAEAKKYTRYFNHYCQLKLWQKFMVLFWMDRGLCKEKVKKYLSGHPWLLKTLKAVYHSGKAIKQKIKRK